MTRIENPVLPVGSLILVTGVNGFIGSHVANELLLNGYRVRGTVRDSGKAKWAQDLFDRLHGAGKFELVEVKDLASEGAFDKAFKDVSGVVHTASILSFSPDPNEVVKPVVEATMNIAKAAAKVPGVKRIVYTSSSMAASSPYPNKEFTITEKSWNDACVKQAWAPPPYEQSRSVAVYGASKTQAEQALWKFVEEDEPSFVLNTVLPSATFGKSLDPKNQGHPSTSGMITKLFGGSKADLEKLPNILPPKYAVDVEDIGRLHAIALLNPKVNGERIFGFAEPFNFNDILAIFRKNFPDRQFPDDWPDLPQDKSKIAPMGRAIELLKECGRPGFTGLEESILNNVKDLVQS